MKLHPKSLVTHWPKIPLKETNLPLVDPIYVSTKFTTQSLSQLEDIVNGDGGYFYSRILNPTVRQLEVLLSQIQGREDALALSSGMAAITTCLLSLLSAGDHVIYFLESYRPTRIFIQEFLKKYGVHATLCSLNDRGDGTLPVIPGKTKLILFESPTNPMTYIQDMDLILGEAKKHGILTILDNTFAGLHQHGNYPIDIFIHSLTKYGGGHGDAMGGAIIASGEIIRKIRADGVLLGPVLDPQAAYFFLRGMKTYFLRYECQARNALILAQKLENHPKIRSLLYPYLPSHPQHHLAKKQMTDGGAVISFDLNVEGKKIEEFISGLKVIKLAASLGSTESMVAPVEMFFSSDFSPQQKKAAGIYPNSLRLSVGIEEVGDLENDLFSALEGI